MRFFFFSLLLVINLRCVAAETRKLNLFIWSEYIDPTVLQEFEKEHEAKITVDLYEDESAMMAKLQGGGAALYDVVVPPDHKVTALLKLNLLSPLKLEKIPNFKHLEPRFTNPTYDRGNKYTVAYQWGTVGIYYRKSGKPLNSSWGMIFDPRQQQGPFVLIDSARDLLGAALKYRGQSLNSTDPVQLKAARDLVIETKKRALAFDASVGGKNKVLSKTAQAAIVFSGEAVRGMTEDPETEYLIPKEGSEIWQDNLAIPAKAPHREFAETFINYLLEPKVAARIANFTQFATANKAAREFIKPEDRNNPAIYPPEEVMKRLEFLQDLGPKTRLYDELWTQIKAR